jgi:putative peptide zinc metalloprotease protein
MSDELRPRLRPRLRFSRHENDGAVSYIVKDPASMKYYRFGTVEAWLMQRLDGTRTLEQLCAELREEIGMNATPQALDVLVRRLREMGLVERSLHERSAMLMERVRQQRRSRRDGKNTLVRMRFSFGDPDPLLGTMTERMPFFWTPGFVAASIAVFGLYTLILGYNWGAFINGMAAVYSPAQMTIGIFIICYGSFVVTAIIHEFGHGLTCKRHGGEVHELGAMLLYFMPAFYCNVSDAWTFEKRSHRLWVTVAGGWIQLWVAAAAALVWIMTEPGTLINSIGLYTAALSGGFSVLFNYNPLIPLDGYYALVDWLDMPNLRGRSFGYVGALAKRHLLRLDSPVPAVTPRERRIFVPYGILAIAYTTTILTTFSLLIGRFLGARLGGWGWLLFALLLFAATARLRGGVARLARVFAAEHLPQGRRMRVVQGGAIALIALAIISSIVPWTVNVAGDAVVESDARRWLRPPQDARFVELRVAAGEVARAGDTVAILRDPELEIERAQLQARLGELMALATAARGRRDATGARLHEFAVQSAMERLEQLDQRRDALVLRAPFDALIATPFLEERIGENVLAGDSLVQTLSHNALHVRVSIPQRAAGELAAGASLRIRFPAHPGRTWHLRVDRVETAVTDGDLIAIASFDTVSDPGLLPGMHGRARAAIARTTVAGALGRTVRRTVRGDLFL